MLAVSLEPREIGKRIAAARKKRGWTQLEFAMAANVSPSTIARWESGKLPPVRELIRIAEVLKVDADEFVEPVVSASDDDRLADLERGVAETRGMVAEILRLQREAAHLDENLDPEQELEAQQRSA